MGITLQHRRAADCMNRHTPTTGDEANDMFARQWVTTQREAHQHIVDALDANPQPPLLLRYQLEQRFERAISFFGPAIELIRRHELDDRMARRDPAITDGRQKRFLILKTELLA